MSKLPNEATQRKLAAKASNGKLTHQQAVALVKQRRGRAVPKRGFKQTFFADNGIKIAVSTPKKVTFDDVAEALTQATEEVRHYIDQGRLAF